MTPTYKYVDVEVDMSGEWTIGDLTKTVTDIATDGATIAATSVVSPVAAAALAGSKLYNAISGQEALENRNGTKPVDSAGGAIDQAKAAGDKLRSEAAMATPPNMASEGLSLKLRGEISGALSGLAENATKQEKKVAEERAQSKSEPRHIDIPPLFPSASGKEGSPSKPPKETSTTSGLEPSLSTSRSAVSMNNESRSVETRGTSSVGLGSGAGNGAVERSTASGRVEGTFTEKPLMTANGASGSDTRPGNTDVRSTQAPRTNDSTPGNQTNQHREVKGTPDSREPLEQSRGGSLKGSSERSDTGAAGQRAQQRSDAGSATQGGSQRSDVVSGGNGAPQRSEVGTASGGNPNRQQSETDGRTSQNSINRNADTSPTNANDHSGQRGPAGPRDAYQDVSRTSEPPKGLTNDGRPTMPAHEVGQHVNQNGSARGSLVSLPESKSQDREQALAKNTAANAKALESGSDGRQPNRPDVPVVPPREDILPLKIQSTNNVLSPPNVAGEPSGIDLRTRTVESTNRVGEVPRVNSRTTTAGEHLVAQINSPAEKPQQKSSDVGALPPRIEANGPKSNVLTLGKTTETTTQTSVSGMLEVTGKSASSSAGARSEVPNGTIPSSIPRSDNGSRSPGSQESNHAVSVVVQGGARLTEQGAGQSIASRITPGETQAPNERMILPEQNLPRNRTSLDGYSPYPDTKNNPLFNPRELNLTTILDRAINPKTDHGARVLQTTDPVVRRVTAEGLPASNLSSRTVEVLRTTAELRTGAPNTVPPVGMIPPERTSGQPSTLARPVAVENASQTRALNPPAPIISASQVHTVMTARPSENTVITNGLLRSSNLSVEAALLKNGQIINGSGLKIADTPIINANLTQTLGGRHGTFTTSMSAKGELINGTTNGASKLEPGINRGETTDKVAKGNREVGLPGEKVGGGIGIRDGRIGLPVLILDGDKKAGATGRTPQAGGIANGANAQIPNDKLGEKTRGEDKNRPGEKVATDKEVKTVRPIVDLTFLGGRRIIDRDVRVGTNNGGRTFTVTGRNERNPNSRQIDNKQTGGKRIDDRQVTGKRIEDQQIAGKRIEDRGIPGKRIVDELIIGKRIDRQIAGKQIEDRQIPGKRIEDRQTAGKRVEDKFTASRRIEDKLIPAPRTNQDISRWLEEKLRNNDRKLIDAKDQKINGAKPLDTGRTTDSSTWLGDKGPERRLKYFVKRGDTLESIAANKLGDRRFATLLLTINRDNIKTDLQSGRQVHTLKEGEVLVLPTLTELRLHREIFFGAKQAPEVKVVREEKKASRKEEYFGPEESFQHKDYDEEDEEKEVTNFLKRLRIAGNRRPVSLGVITGSTSSNRREYRVRLGDTLRSICLRDSLMGDAGLWPLLARVNNMPETTNGNGQPSVLLRRGLVIQLPNQDEVEYYRFLKSLEQRCAAERTTSGAKPPVQPPAAINVSIEQLGSHCRMVAAERFGLNFDSNTRLQTSLLGGWTTIACYETRLGQSCRFVYQKDGSQLQYKLDLPATVIKEMAAEDFKRNYSAYLAIFIKADNRMQTSSVGNVLMQSPGPSAAVI